MPRTGAHSTIDRPEWVSRVTPPSTTIANTSAQHTKSHAAIWVRAPSAGEPTWASLTSMRPLSAIPPGGTTALRTHKGEGGTVWDQCS